MCHRITFIILSMIQVSATGWDDETVNSWNWSTEWTERCCVWVRWDYGLLSTHRYTGTVSTVPVCI